MFPPAESGHNAPRREVASGVLLIAGALLGVAVMALHPTGHDLALARERFAATASLNAIVHGVALLATPVVFLGLLGVARRLGWSDLAVAALVAWGFGVAAVIGAAVASGFVAPAVLRASLPADAASVSERLAAYT